MLKPVISTYKILKEKACNADINESWIKWAIEMMEAGFEVDSLYELAGISKPFNQFELHDLTDKVLDDLNLEYSNKEKVIKNYAYYLIKSNAENQNMYFEVLKEFRDIYYELDMDTEYQYFALLYWAKEDLDTADVQWYWDGANKTNINKIIKEQFNLWIEKFESNK